MAKEFEKTECGRIQLQFGKYKYLNLDEVETEYLQWIVREASKPGQCSFSEEFLLEVEEELRCR